MVARARLEAQRRVLSDKLQSLGNSEVAPVGLDDDQISVTSNNSVSPFKLEKKNPGTL